MPGGHCLHNSSTRYENQGPNKNAKRWNCPWDANYEHQCDDGWDVALDLGLHSSNVDWALKDEPVCGGDRFNSYGLLTWSGGWWDYADRKKAKCVKNASSFGTNNAKTDPDRANTRKKCCVDKKDDTNWVMNNCENNWCDLQPTDANCTPEIKKWCTFESSVTASDFKNTCVNYTDIADKGAHTKGSFKSHRAFCSKKNRAGVPYFKDPNNWCSEWCKNNADVCAEITVLSSLCAESDNIIGATCQAACREAGTDDNNAEVREECTRLMIKHCAERTVDENFEDTIDDKCHCFYDNDVYTKYQDTLRAQYPGIPETFYTGSPVCTYPKCMLSTGWVPETCDKDQNIQICINKTTVTGDNIDYTGNDQACSQRLEDFKIAGPSSGDDTRAPSSGDDTPAPSSGDGNPDDNPPTEPDFASVVKAYFFVEESGNPKTELYIFIAMVVLLVLLLKQSHPKTLVGVLIVFAVLLFAGGMWYLLSKSGPEEP